MYEVQDLSGQAVEGCSDRFPDDIWPDFTNSVGTLCEVPNETIDEKERQSLRYIYTHSCQQHRVRPNADVLRQLPSFVGDDWVKKIKVLDFSLAYVGRDGCAALVPVIGLCTSMTHLLMPSIGLTEEAAWLLLAVLQTHPSLTWMDLSGNQLNDNVGRWILNMVLENPTIQFVLLRDAGISLPLVSKISRQLHREKHERAGGLISFKQSLNLDRLSCSFETTLSASISTYDASRGRRIPAFVAAGLAELRHRLHRNRHCIQKVYECFMLPKAEADGIEDECGESVVDIVNMNGEWDTVSISAMYTGKCSWRAFFRGLRLLGIHAVSRSLTESVTFATICGICNLETIYFGKLLSFLRPHVALKTVAPWKTDSSSTPHWIVGVDEYSLTSELQESAVGTTQRPFSSSTPHLLSALRVLSRSEAGNSACSFVAAENVAAKSFNPESLSLILKPRNSADLRRKTAPGKLSLGCSNTFNSKNLLGLTNSGTPVGTLEDQFKLDRFFASREMQYVVDRLYDARDTLRESFQPGDGDDTVTPFMITVDGLMEQAVSFLGESYRDKVLAVLKSSDVEKEVCPTLHLEKWLNSMYIPETGGSNVPPFSLSQERGMWRGVEVERLQSVLQLY
ncbi:hypothetical protein MOQ_001330 [Trypanosoma cruzi marinkellei]|uniref:Uncharacterized protein n=1 Tax=Trypanosoma cruzi marinkellei TaxID=85056 RepID=K2PBH2_TRYCR|nr:hypothetical protein MOQ_001330 [Trypanosoma cruzi marinkellei]